MVLLADFNHRASNHCLSKEADSLAGAPRSGCVKMPSIPTTQALTLCRSPVLEGSGRMNMIASLMRSFESGSARPRLFMIALMIPFLAAPGPHNNVYAGSAAHVSPRSGSASALSVQAARQPKQRPATPCSGLFAISSSAVTTCYRPQQIIQAERTLGVRPIRPVTVVSHVTHVALVELRTVQFTGMMRPGQRLPPVTSLTYIFTQRPAPAVDLSGCGSVSPVCPPYVTVDEVTILPISGTVITRDMIPLTPGPWEFLAAVPGRKHLTIHVTTDLSREIVRQIGVAILRSTHS